MEKIEGGRLPLEKSGNLDKKSGRSWKLFWEQQIIEKVSRFQKLLVDPREKVEMLTESQRKSEKSQGK